MFTRFTTYFFQRKNLTSGVRQGNDGVTWLPRFAVLSDDKLAFVKAEGDETIIDFIPLSVSCFCHRLNLSRT